MEENNNYFGRKFFTIALILLSIGLLGGVFSAIVYVSPEFLKSHFGLVKLRPIHVSSAMFWIIMGATACVFSGLSYLSKVKPKKGIVQLQISLWIVAFIGIYYSYIVGDFGGREYWEFNPIWALPILISWFLFLVNFIHMAKTIKKWPVYVWMWMTGIIFFTFIFIENYLWIIPYFREDFVHDMTIQWKVNGSLVGSINQMIYGTAFFLMDRINKDEKSKVGFSKLAFAMYFLGLANLMFNWGHHIYTLPTDYYVRFVAYAVSMTEWIFFIKIIYNWRKSVKDINKNYHFFPYRFLMAADFWVFINMGQAIIMSIPVFNVFTHGTHVTVAHSMGTTIGINSMIIFAAAFMFLTPKKNLGQKPSKLLNITFWTTQIGLFILFTSLNIAGILKGIWQHQEQQSSFGKMMESLQPYFVILLISGIVLLFAFSVLISTLFKYLSQNKPIHEKGN
ncbi:MAG: cbb3-type cytochrome c oxidase subunit I [Crocinitomicaceae bacterium]